MQGSYIIKIICILPARGLGNAAANCGMNNQIMIPKMIDHQILFALCEVALELQRDKTPS